MKLRIKGNSIRFRLTQSEVKIVEQTGLVKDQIKFSIFAFLRPLPWFNSEMASKMFVFPEPLPPYINMEEFFKLRFKLLWFLKFFKLIFLI